MGDLAADIVSTVRRHLIEAYNLIGDLLARIEVGADPATRTSVSPPSSSPSPSPPAKEDGGEPRVVIAPVTAGKSPSRATIERQARKLRQREREKAAAVANGPSDAPDWNSLRVELRERIRSMGVTYGAVAAATRYSKGTIRTWLSAQSMDSPSAKAQQRFRDWLVATSGPDAPPAPDAIPEDPPAFKLTASEQDRLLAAVSIDSAAHALRARYGATRELLDKAIAGQPLPEEFISRLRVAISGNGSAEAI